MHCLVKNQQPLPCSCDELRQRLLDIYHITLCYGDQPVLALQAIRKATGR